MGRHNGFGVSRLVLIAAAAPSLIKRPDFPYGLDEETVLQMIEDTYNDRPEMLRNFAERFFFQHVTPAFSDWFFQLGLEAAGWATTPVLAIETTTPPASAASAAAGAEVHR